MNSIYSLVILSFLQCYLLIEKSCAERINVTATVGENVTLRVPERRIIQIIDVTWVTRGWYHFVTTAPGGNVVIRDAHYKGRLRCSNDASLTITNVTLEDQGRYTASILLSDGDTYGQIYHIRMLDGSRGQTIPVVVPMPLLIVPVIVVMMMTVMMMIVLSKRLIGQSTKNPSSGRFPFIQRLTNQLSVSHKLWTLGDMRGAGGSKIRLFHNYDLPSTCN
ncbi:uncharacterized protein LOC142108170 isoform X1 [Mixophyes fleayi]|uniref:uncharacterized protein LOC142108170 isoform X1 n=1 Tax=Mixophyes fleayi TaxID=3061075 RepID=UPI003F4DF05F